MILDPGSWSLDRRCVYIYIYIYIHVQAHTYVHIDTCFRWSQLMLDRRIGGGVASSQLVSQGGPQGGPQVAIRGHLGIIWEASGIHLEPSGTHLEASGRSLKNTWHCCNMNQSNASHPKYANVCCDKLCGRTTHRTLQQMCVRSITASCMIWDQVCIAIVWAS